MPEFILDTTGQVLQPAQGRFVASATVKWSDLDAFTQGYIEALFFTSKPVWEDGVTEEDAQQAYDDMVEALGFSDLAPEALARIIDDCAKFQAGAAMTAMQAAPGDAARNFPPGPTIHAGRDFWYTRNGHGCGFWDGDWPGPYATQLTDAAKAFGEVDLYLGDDGKVYLA